MVKYYIRRVLRATEPVVVPRAGLRRVLTTGPKAEDGAREDSRKGLRLGRTDGEIQGSTSNNILTRGKIRTLLRAVIWVCPRSEQC